MNIKKAVFAVSIILLAFSCNNNDDSNNSPDPLGVYENGLFITNEGNYSQGNGSVSFISDDLTYVENNVFSNVNGSLLGDTVQSIGFNGELAYIVVNNSQKIEVVNRYTFESVATISSGLMNPRFITFVSGKGYVTNWGDGTDPSDDFIAVINLGTNAVESTIPVEEGPEKILANGTTIYVAHQGGYSQNNIVSVINTSSNTVSTVTVGDVPNSLQIVGSNSLYVMCGGKPSWIGDETAGQLMVINTSNNAVEKTYDFSPTQHPSNLVFEGSSLYYMLDGSIFEMASGAANLPTTAEFENVFFYEMTVKNGKLFAADAGDFTSNGFLKVYDLATKSEIATKEVGVIPNGIFFNN